MHPVRFFAPLRMTCRNMQALISPWLDGEMEPAAEQSLADHLAQCARCRGRADAMRDMRGGFQRLPLIEPSHDFDARVWIRIEQLSTSRLRRWLAGVGEATADLAPRWATAVFVAATLIATLYWAAQGATRATGGLGEPYGEIQRMLDSRTITAPVALDEPGSIPRPFWSPRNG